MIWTGDDIVTFANFKAKASEGPTSRGIALALEIEDWLAVNECKPSFAIIEEPFIDVHGSRTRAAAQRQDVVKLTILVGNIQTTLAKLGCEVHMVPVIRWKGQLPKELVWARSRDWLVWGDVDKTLLHDLEASTSHVQDAVGLGIYAIKKLDSGRIP